MVPNKRAVKYVLTLNKACNVRKMFCKGFFSGVFKIMEHLFFSEHFQGSNCGKIFVRWEAVQLYKGTPLHNFSWICFSKFSVKLFQNTITKASAQGLVVFFVVYHTHVLIKKWLHQAMFPEISVMGLFLHKSLQFIPILVAFYNISKSRFVRRHCLTGYR